MHCKLMLFKGQLYVHTMEHYEGLKKEILLHATTPMNFEDVNATWDKPVTKAQIQYDSTHMKNLKVVNIIETENSIAKG